MAWIYLAESEGSRLPWQIGFDQSPIVSVIDTLKRSSCPKCETDVCRWPECGTTCEPLTPRNFLHALILSMADSRARTSALQALEQAWRASKADFISNSKGLSEKQSQLSYSLKTSLRSGHADLAVWCGDFPSSGMILDGQLYQPKKLAPVTLEKDGSFLLTPTAQNYGHNRGGAAGRKGKRRHSMQSMAARGLIPTPMARDWKGSGGANRKSPDLSFTMGGLLNPRFVEEVMGYEIGWTDIRGNIALEAWATQWFQAKRAKRSKD